MTENCDGIHVRHNLWRKLWRTNIICDGWTVSMKSSAFCDGWFHNCDGNSVTIMTLATVCDGSVTIRHKFLTIVTDCDGSVTIPGPIFFCFRCAVQLNGTARNFSPHAAKPDFTQPLLLSTYPVAGDPNPPHNPTLHPPHKPTTGEDAVFRPAQRSWERDLPFQWPKSCSSVQNFRPHTSGSGTPSAAGELGEVSGRRVAHGRAANGTRQSEVIVTIFANCSLVFGWIECGLVKITSILQIQMYVLWHLIAYGSFV